MKSKRAVMHFRGRRMESADQNCEGLRQTRARGPSALGEPALAPRGAAHRHLSMAPSGFPSSHLTTHTCTRAHTRAHAHAHGTPALAEVSSSASSTGRFSVPPLQTATTPHSQSS